MGPSIKDVKKFWAVFDTPFPHVGILTLIYLTSTFWYLTTSLPPKIFQRLLWMAPLQYLLTWNNFISPNRKQDGDPWVVQILTIRDQLCPPECFTIRQYVPHRCWLTIFRDHLERVQMLPLPQMLCQLLRYNSTHFIRHQLWKTAVRNRQIWLIQAKVG